MSAVAYFDRRAEGYSARGRRGPWRAFRDAEWAALKPRLRLSRGCSVLDAGCGDGHYSALMSAEGAVVEGVDASERMIAAYRERGFRGERAALEHLSPGPAFDRVLAAGVLEFVEDGARAIANLAARLRPGGRLVCLIPAGGAAGAVYRAFHAAAGCPCFIRTSRAYGDWARAAGLTPGDAAAATPISRVLCLERP